MCYLMSLPRPDSLDIVFTCITGCNDVTPANTQYEQLFTLHDAQQTSVNIPSDLVNTPRISFCIQMRDDKQGVAKLVNQTIGLNINQAGPKNPPGLGLNLSQAIISQTR